MGFPDYDFTGPQHSYVYSNEVLDFIRVYAQKFQVDRHIRLRHEIVRIQPREMTSKWEVKIEIIFFFVFLNKSEINLQIINRSGNGTRFDKRFH